MILPLIILYVVTLVYLAITERFRNFASLIGLQGWLLFAVALVRLHAINPAELAFICLETLLFKGILVPGLLFAVIRRTKINRVSRSGSTQSGSLLLSLVALAVSASVTYYIADTTIDLVFFGVAFYSLLSGLILIVMRRRIFSHMVGFLVIENGVFLFYGHRRRDAAADQLRHPARHPHLGADAGHLLHQNRRQAPCRRRRFTHQRKGLTP